MGLKIFGDAPKADAAPKTDYANDVVGRFRSGYQINDRPAALQEWRVTTGDPEVAEAVRAIMGGDPAQKWAAKGEDDLEVYTKTKSLDVIIEGSRRRDGQPRGLTQRLVLWGRNGKPIYSTDGATKDDGQPDPDAHLSLQERKQKARDGVGPEPQIEVLFRLADDPDLGIFKFVSGSWSLLNDLNYYSTEEALIDAAEDGDGFALVTLGLEEVSFTAKNGPQAGRVVSFTKPTLKVQGPADYSNGDDE